MGMEYFSAWLTDRSPCCLLIYLSHYCVVCLDQHRISFQNREEMFQCQMNSLQFQVIYMRWAFVRTPDPIYSPLNPRGRHLLWSFSAQKVGALLVSVWLKQLCRPQKLSPCENLGSMVPNSKMPPTAGFPSYESIPLEPLPGLRPSDLTAIDFKGWTSICEKGQNSLWGLVTFPLVPCLTLDKKHIKEMEKNTLF